MGSCPLRRTGQREVPTSLRRSGSERLVGEIQRPAAVGVYLMLSTGLLDGYKCVLALLDRSPWTARTRSSQPPSSVAGP
jgi:hypothetical protein